MKERIDPEKIAKALGAELRGSIKAGGGYFGALQVADDVRRFYDELAPDYDAIYVDWDSAVARNGALLDHLLGPGADPILDVAAGMGTQAIGLALKGHRVVSRDLSPRLVARGREEAARHGAAVDFDVGDMCEARATDAGRFGAVIACGNALPHLDPAQLRDALGAAFAALRPGGPFVAEIRDYDALAAERPSFVPAEIMGVPPDRRITFQVWTWAADGQSLDIDLIVLREATGWQSARYRTHYRALKRAELEEAARLAGFTDLRWLEPAESGAWQPIFLGRRP
jgi:SAM-dependent methyltransferase